MVASGSHKKNARWAHARVLPLGDIAPSMLTRNEILYIRSLRDRNTRISERKFVVEGHKCVDEALRSGWEVHGLFATEAAMGSVTGDAAPVSSKEMDRMSAFKSPPGVLAVVEMPDDTNMSAHDWVGESDAAFGLALDGLSDPGNLGTLLRTADWLGIQGVWASPRVVDAFNPKVVQASMGAVFRVQVWRCELATHLTALREAGALVYGMDMAGQDAWAMPGTPGSPSPWVAVLGSESHGLSPEVMSTCTEQIHIPGRGGSESLNATMAAGMVLGEWGARLHRQSSASR